MKKYELTDEKKNYLGVTLHRIRALRDFADVKAGDIGGWIEKEENLSHYDNCWVYDNGIVCGSGKVRGNGRVYGYGEVCGNGRVYGNGWVSKPSDILITGPTGSRDDFTTFYKTVDGGIGVTCGCFIGTLDEFLEAVEKTHGDNKKFRSTYKKLADAAKSQILGV